MQDDIGCAAEMGGTATSRQQEKDLAVKTSTSMAAWIRAGLFALPVYGILVAYATRNSQPDQTTDPDAWAAFVSTPEYLVEHVLSSVVGAALVILGTMALGVLLSRTRAARLGVTGMVLSVVAQVLFMVPGVISTFATPAIGAAYLAGNRDAMTIVFPEILGGVFALALLLAAVGNVLLGIAIWRSRALPRWTGLVWAAAAVTFYVLGTVVGIVTVGASIATQPIGAGLLAISATGIIWSVMAARGRAAKIIDRAVDEDVAVREAAARGGGVRPSFGWCSGGRPERWPPAASPSPRRWSCCDRCGVLVVALAITRRGDRLSRTMEIRP